MWPWIGSFRLKVTAPEYQLGGADGRPRPGRRFRTWASNGKLTAATGIEDNLKRMRELSLRQ